MDEFNLIGVLFELNEISSKIVELYDKVLIGIINKEDIRILLIKLKLLIKEENNIIERIPKNKLTDCLEFLEETLSEDDFIFEDDYDTLDEDDYEDSLRDLDNDFYCDNEAVIERMNNKIMQAKEISDNKIIILDNLGLVKNKELKGILSIYDAIGALILIETIQMLNKIIGYARPYPKEISYIYYESDVRFLNELDIRLDEYKIKAMRTYSTIEVLVLENNISIEQISKETIDIIKMVISNVYDTIYENMIDICIKEVINKLAEKNIIKNTADNIFEYLELIVKLDILLFNTDKALLPSLEKYCEEKNFKNKGIKKRLKVIFKEHKGQGKAKIKD